jgi:hypothetical protein
MNKEQTADEVIVELKKTIERLQKANKKLREDSDGWRRLTDGLTVDVARLREEARQRKEVEGDIWKLRHEQMQLQMERFLKPAVLSEWFRQLSLRYHPDRGGSEIEMKVVNAAYTLLKQLLGKAT